MRTISCLYIIILLALNVVQAKTEHQLYHTSSDQIFFADLLQLKNISSDSTDPVINSNHRSIDSLPYFMLPFSFRVYAVQSLADGDLLISLQFHSIGLNEEIICRGRGRLKADPDDLRVHAFREVGNTGVFFLAIPSEILAEAESNQQPFGWELEYPITVNGFFGTDTFTYTFLLQVTELTIQFMEE